jgi:hypothetical protein
MESLTVKARGTSAERATVHVAIAITGMKSFKAEIRVDSLPDVLDAGIYLRQHNRANSLSQKCALGIHGLDNSDRESAASERKYPE